MITEIPETGTRVGYIVSRYPLLSETFILRELWELERQGWRLRLYPLRRVQARVQHGRVTALRAPVWVAPWCDVRAHWRRLRRQPLAYLRTLAEVLWDNRGDLNLLAGVLAYWGKAIAVAEQMERDGVRQVHAHYATHPTLVAYVVFRLTGIPYSFTAHAHDLYCHTAMLGKKLERAAYVVTISRYNRRLLAAHRPGLAKPIHVIHCGVEPGRYGGNKVEAHCANGGLRLLAVGSLQPYKGHRHLISACAGLRGQLAFECRIAGEGGLRPRLAAQIRAAGLETSQVRLLGAATEAEVGELLAWADVFVLPSVVDERTGQMEGIPVALMEAMAAGVAVVASRLSGIPELIEDGVNGLLVPPGNVEQLQRAIRRLTDASLRARLSAQARRAIDAEFELTNNVRRLSALMRAGRRAAVEEGAGA